MYILFGLVSIFCIISITRGFLKEHPEKRLGYLLKNFLLIYLVIILLFLFGPFFMISPVKIGYQTLNENNITIYYPTNKFFFTNEILEMTKKAVLANEQFYRRPLNVNILLASSDLDMLRFGVHPKGNGAGLPWGIVIRISKASWNIIAHELSHQNLAKIAPFGLSTFFFPRWFDEGLACYIGKMDYYKNISDLKDDLDTGRYQYDITDWNGLNGQINWINQTFFQANAKTIYGQTYLMIKYLADSFSEEQIYQLIEMVGKGKSFNDAFKEIFGISVNDFHQEFIEFIKKN